MKDPDARQARILLARIEWLCQAPGEHRNLEGMQTSLAKKLRNNPDKSVKVLAEVQVKVVELEERLKRIENYLKPGSHPDTGVFGRASA